eukprot:4917711-Amphidinium_carterae.3
MAWCLSKDIVEVFWCAMLEPLQCFLGEVQKAIASTVNLDYYLVSFVPQSSSAGPGTIFCSVAF